MADIWLSYRVEPGEENFAMVTALILSRFVRGCRNDMTQPGLIYILVSRRGVGRIKTFFAQMGKVPISEGSTSPI